MLWIYLYTDDKELLSEITDALQVAFSISD
jgi:hypothetical protein